ncbi:MAG: hypothetical protein KGI54_15125 [Pseudomonadota bacterium]|nr:hypothetical protein [Pseudomonadota bacterium]
MYLIFDEDGTITKISFLSKDDLQGAEDGYQSIIDISDPENPLEYDGGNWLEIDNAEDY